MLLVNSKLVNEKAMIDTSSPESTARIRVEFDKGKFVKADPDSTILFLGDG